MLCCLALMLTFPSVGDASTCRVSDILCIIPANSHLLIVFQAGRGRTVIHQFCRLMNTLPVLRVYATDKFEVHMCNFLRWTRVVYLSDDFVLDFVSRMFSPETHGSPNGTYQDYWLLFTFRYYTVSLRPASISFGETARVHIQ
ncbi:hypothetical protein B0H10DRAFT_387642 [Mycena sp. CBHHK59/15]|nr:hypothetical protein B0H10DRAFT_387642 [Mycena sp. CBHHK59/15]